MEIKREIRIRNEKDQISGRGLRSNHICNSWTCGECVRQKLRYLPRGLQGDIVQKIASQVRDVIWMITFSWNR
jgi:hypothetical protein